MNSPDTTYDSPRSTVRRGAFPVPNWDRYEVIGFVGAGGMGQVFKAKDPRLDREVALKFIRGDEPERVQRFFREARAQARAVHEFICKVYEVGEVEGYPFIAMEYIDGCSLKEVKDQMTREQKVKIIKEVAIGLHEAHRLGLIHRDIKPSNIMVDRDESGAFRPHIVDFGLARDIEMRGQTQTGIFEGTPAYMPPEQARGETKRMDRRVDVYALGATLYEILGGRAPFIGSNSLEILLAMINEDVEPIRKLDPDMPWELETIVMKCLEKEPNQRYDSARALAEDLQRYLDGDPIQAQRATVSYVIRKKIKKHKALALIASAALVLVTVLGGVALRTRLSAATQANLAQQLGQDVTEMELFLRYAHGLPLHDATREKEIILSRMREIEARMRQIGAAAEGPGNYALGRGYLSLGRYEEADEHLLQAWSQGYRKPEVAYALGLCRGELYNHVMDEAQRIPDTRARQARIKEGETKYLEPALSLLRESQEAQTKVESRVYLEGLIAFYSKHYQEALSKVEEAWRASPWLGEAKKLEGDVWHAQASAEKQRGSYDEALRDYRRAAEAYRAAEDMARSDAAAYEAESQVWLEALEMAWERGSPPKEFFAKATEACDKALAADPESARSYSRKALAYWRLGEYQANTGEDPSAALGIATAAALEAIRRDPEDAGTLDALGNVYRTRAAYDASRNDDPRASLDSSAEYFRKATEVRPLFAWPWNDLGNALTIKGEYEVEHGVDPRPSFDKASEVYKKSAEVDPSYAYPLANLCYALERRAEYEVSIGLDPRPTLARAVEGCEKSRQVNPSYLARIVNQATSLWLRGRYEQSIGLDSRSWFESAAGLLTSEVQGGRADLDAYAALGKTYHALGEYALERREDPSAILSQGEAIVRKMLELAPTDPRGCFTEGLLTSVAARWGVVQHKAPEPHFKRAEAAFARTLALQNKRPETFLAVAQLHRVEAEWYGKQPARAAESIILGLEASEAALGINPRMSEVLAVRGELLLLAVRLARAPLQAQEHAAGALSSLLEAVKQNPSSEPSLGPSIAEARRLAAR